MFIDKIDLEWRGAKFDIELKHNITLISGESGVGKTLLYDALVSANRLKKIDVPVVGINCTTNKIVIKNMLDSLKGCLVIIDNSDIVLLDEQNII